MHTIQSKSFDILLHEMHVDQKTVVRHLAIIRKVKSCKIRFDVPIRPIVIKCNDLMPRLTCFHDTKKTLFQKRIVTCDEKQILLNNRMCSAQWLNKDEFLDTSLRKKPSKRRSCLLYVCRRFVSFVTSS